MEENIRPGKAMKWIPSEQAERGRPRKSWVDGMWKAMSVKEDHGIAEDAVLVGVGQG